MKNDYIVVLRTADGGRYDGVVASMTFRSKAAYIAWYAKEGQSRYEVIETGVSRERADALCAAHAAEEAALKSGFGDVRALGARTEFSY